MAYLLWVHGIFNTLRPRQNGHHFADDNFKCIFFNENVRISIEISLKFVPKGGINNIPSLVQIMAWRRPGNKPLSESMMVRSPMHICIAWPQWVKLLLPCCMQYHLTYWGWDKKATILQRTFKDAFSWMKMNEFWLLDFIPKGPIDNVPALV